MGISVFSAMIDSRCVLRVACSTRRATSATDLPGLRLARLQLSIQPDDFIDDAVFHGFVGPEEPVALAVFADAIGGLAGALGHDADEGFLGLEDLLGLDFDIGRLPINAAKRLVNHD